MPTSRLHIEEAAVSRRELLVAAGALAAAASVASGGTARAAEHEHSAHALERPELLSALESCTSSGRLCIHHCLARFREGDTSLAACAAKVNEMLAVCSAMTTLVASNSSYVKGMAGTCSKVCEDCSAACREHAEKHKECRDCMEACDRVVAALKKLVA
jgi:Cys-rich four helix bundle protein (predicted Tat secretion target)